MKLHFNKPYFIATLVLFVIETLIALHIKTGFIRHTFGDYLVVILLYCFFRSFIKTKAIYLATIILAISFTIECLQLTNLLEILNLQDHTFAKTLLGSTFSISDLIAYTLGVITIYLIDNYYYLPSTKS